MSSSSQSSPRIERASPGPAPAVARWAVFIACLLIALGASPAHAGPSPGAVAGQSTGGTVHVCVDARGLREFRDTPCAVHQRSLRTIAFERAPSAPELLSRSRDTAREMERRNAGAQRRAARIAVADASARKERAPDACAAAKTRRDQMRERARPRLNYAQRRRLDREVWLQCPNG